MAKPEEGKPAGKKEQKTQGGGAKAADAKGLQDLLGHPDFFGAIAAGSGGEGNTDGIADALLQKHAQRGAGGDDPFGSHASFGEAEVQRVGAPRGE